MTEDGKTRLATLAEAEGKLLSDAPVLPLYHSVSFNVLDLNAVTGWYQNPLDVHPFKSMGFGTPKARPYVASPLGSGGRDRVEPGGSDGPGERPGESFLLSLGFPGIKVHRSFDHFDFTKPGRRILVIGPMGSGKTEYSARVWRDSRVALKKSSVVAARTTTAGADRRIMHFVRFGIDKDRFNDYPDDALPYRGGYERCGDSISCRGRFVRPRVDHGRNTPRPAPGYWTRPRSTTSASPT